MIPKHLLESKIINDEKWEEFLLLKEENKQLKQRIDKAIEYIEEAIYNHDEIFGTEFLLLKEENKQLKQRIDKAIEYIEEAIYNHDEIFETELLTILKRDDKDVFSNI